MVMIPVPLECTMRIYRSAISPVEVSTISTLHIYRHLLRAASYLPDEFAEAYIRRHVRENFQKYRKTCDSSPARLKNARSSLRELEQAANGEIKALTKVLHRAYGRSGRRRRELMNDLLRADVNSVQDTGRWESPGPLLKLFISSQATNQPLDNERTELRRLEPNITTNIWGRPMPLKRRKNHEKRFWATTLDKLLPPLPELEWNRLRDLATGVIPFKKPPARRTRICVTPPTSMIATSKLLTKPVRSTNLSERYALLAEREYHIIDARFMRRIWARVWNRCPKMTYDGETMKWTVIWGGGRSAISQNLTGSAGSRDLELWNGLSERDSKPLPRPRQTKIRIAQKRESL